MNASDGSNIEQITMDDLDTLVELHSIYLNYGEGIRPHFEKVIRDESTVALKYVDDGKIVAVLIYINGIEFTSPHDSIKKAVMELTGDKKVYTGDAVLVVSGYRGRNIAHSMYEYAKREMMRMGVEYVMHELWVMPDGRVPAKKVTDVFGKSVCIGVYDNFYKDFDRYGYICPVCGTKCICSAEIHVSEIN